MSALNDRDLIERQLRPWLAEEGMVREPEDLFERVATGTRRVRQRPGWIVRFMRNGMAGAGAGPAARWREPRMATAFGLGTIVIALAVGVGSIGSGLLPGPGVAPGAVSDAPSPSASPTEPAVVTGTFTTELVQSYGTTVEEGGIYWTEGPWWKIAWEASDPRLSGQGTKVSNWNGSVATQVGIGAETYVLVNPDGQWVGSSQFFTTGPTGGDDLVVLHGEGDYDGLTAALSIDWGGTATFEGVIFPGEAPTIPEPVEPPAD